MDSSRSCPALEGEAAPAYPSRTTTEDAVAAQDKARWDGMKRTLRHLMIAAAILGVAAALLFLVLADVMCLGDFCGS